MTRRARRCSSTRPREARDETPRALGEVLEARRARPGAGRAGSPARDAARRPGGGRGVVDEDASGDAQRPRHLRARFLFRPVPAVSLIGIVEAGREDRLGARVGVADELDALARVLRTDQAPERDLVGAEDARVLHLQDLATEGARAELQLLPALPLDLPPPTLPPPAPSPRLRPPPLHHRLPP